MLVSRVHPGDVVRRAAGATVLAVAEDRPVTIVYLGHGERGELGRRVTDEWALGPVRPVRAGSDREPVTWTRQERAKGQAWGLQTIGTFHTHASPAI